MSLVRTLSRLTLAFGLVVVATPHAQAGVSPQGDTAAAWPVAWNSYRMADGTGIYDVLGDENPDNADLSSGPCTGSGCSGTSPTVYYASDGTNAFFRMRIAVDPADATKGGLTGNAYLTQIAVNGTVVAVAGVDGKSASVDYVYVASAPGTTVTQVYTYPFTSPSAGMRVVSDGAGDYFIDWQVPIARLTTISGGAITATTPIQMYWGSSAAANLATLNKDLMLGNTNTVSFTNLSTVSFSPSSLSTTSTAAATSGPAPTVGETTQYTVTWTVTNGGGGELTNAASTATLPAGVTFVSGGTGVSSSGSTVSWTAGTLLPGQTKTATFVVALTPAAGTQGTNVPLLSQASASGTDLATSAPRTATAPAITVGPVAAPPPPPNGTPTAGADTLTVAENGSNSVNVLANDSDPDGDPLTVTVTGAPAHGSTSVSGGVVTYTPTPGYDGPDSFTYTACDPSNACAATTVSVTVTPAPPTNTAPTAGADTLTVAENASNSVDVLANDSDPDGDPLTVTVTGAPAHGSTSVSGGVVTYTPTPGYDGPDSFTYSACDPSGACASATVSVTVTPAPPTNAAPNVGADTLTVAEDASNTVDVLANDSDPDGDALTVTVTGGPAHGTTSVAGGVVTYTPGADYNGPDSFTYSACDPSGACASTTVTVTVTPVNDAPAGLANTAFSTAEDTAHMGTLPTATDVDGDSLTYSAVTQPAHGTVTVAPGGGFTYTPDANYHGPDSFGYQACDASNACVPATATVTVTPVNDPPAAIDPMAFSTPEDTAKSGSLPAASDVDGDALTYAVTTLPDHGAVTVNPDGTYTYTPDADYHGPDTFGYRVCDPSNACSAATATVTVTPVNDAPAALDGTAFSTPEDTAKSGSLPAGSDVDGDALTYSVTTQPDHGTLTVNPDGTYTYTPDANYTGPDSFGYQVCDPSNACAPAAAAVTVTPVNDAPGTLPGLAVSTPEDTAKSGSLPAGSDVDGDALTYSVTSQPDHGAVTVNPDGTYTYTPDANYHGPDTFGYQACDTSDACSAAAASVTVTPVDDPPPAPPGTSFSTPEDVAHSGTLPGSVDPDGDALTFSVVTGPSNGTVTVNPDGTFTYTPNPGHVGGDGFTYQVCDPAGACAPATVTITVIDVVPGNVAPVAGDDAPETMAGQPVVVNVLANDNDADGDALAISSVTQGAHGAVTIGAGTVTYTPDAGFTGTDTFTYTVCDASLACDTATVTVAVLAAPPPPNQAPVANAGDDVAIAPGTVVHLDGSTSSDPDGDPLTFSWVQVSGPTVTLTGANTATPSFTVPATGGPVVLQLTVSDGTDTDTDTVTIAAAPVVVDPPAPPACDDTSVVVDTGSSVTVVLGCDNATGAAVTVPGAPAHGSVEVLSDGSIRYTPAPGYVGTDAFTVRVCVDGVCTEANVSVTVRGRSVPRPSRLPSTGGGAEALLPMGVGLVVVGVAALRRGTRAGRVEA